MKKILIALGVFLCIMLVVIIVNCSGDDDVSDNDVPDNAAADNTESVWTICEFKDEFNNPTGEKYLKATTTGTFDNSMGNDQELKVEVQATADGVNILLWEYGNFQLESDYTKKYNVTVLDPNGTKHNYDAYMHDGKPYLVIAHITLSAFYERATELLDFFEMSGTVSFYIADAEDKDNTYSFSVKTEGFSDLFEQIAPSDEGAQ